LSLLFRYPLGRSFRLPRLHVLSHIVFVHPLKILKLLFQSMDWDSQGHQVSVNINSLLDLLLSFKSISERQVSVDILLVVLYRLFKHRHSQRVVALDVV
jgi:hypothetical protein